MLRGFLLISLLLTIAAIAVLGFRGEKTTNEPWEIFPDMVRQIKVRAQSPLNFFADGRGPRMPVNGTVPIGYEMPKAQPIGAPESHPVAGFSVGTDYIDTGKMGNTMMAYGPNIMVADRWAIIAYLRALERSQNAAIVDVPPEHRADLEKPAENKPAEAKPGEAKPAETKSPAKPEAPKK